jgi:acetaldehyde dehydrogenase/alcohol dehydrogenase
MAIIDAELMMNMPKGLTAASGIDALTHALEAYVSVLASEFSNGQALEAIRLVFKYLPEAYENGTTAVKAREKMAHASTIAGMAFANAFLGICHSMAHKLGAMFHVPHGVANGLLISEVVRFNSVDNPRKQAAFPQYKYPNAKWRYARVADYLELGGKNDDFFEYRVLLFVLCGRRSGGQSYGYRHGQKAAERNKALACQFHDLPPLGYSVLWRKHITVYSERYLL